MILGAIGDDFTGSSDLGLMLAKGGLATRLHVGTPAEPSEPVVEAGIVALKSRTLPAAEAVAQSLAALDWLRAQGCRTIFFKYCSTFDSTPEGNIGPVLDALVAALGVTEPVLVCPAFPATGRTVYQGHLFVGDRLLSQSGMEHHPLTPMTDPDIRRWLALQTRLPVGHLPLGAVRGDLRAALAAAGRDGPRLVVADAVEDADLLSLAAAAADHPLLSGGSGLAQGLGPLFGAGVASAPWRGEAGRAIALSGSCSPATLGQVARHREAGGPALRLDPGAILGGKPVAEAALAWAAAQAGLPLLFTTSPAAEVAATQSEWGRAETAAAVERTFGAIAAGAAEAGFARIIAAGGETSGAVVQALGARTLEIGPEIAPGVPALRVAGKPLALALKSGNFGGRDFFAEAAAVLAG